MREYSITESSRQFLNLRRWLAMELSIQKNTSSGHAYVLSTLKTVLHGLVWPVVGSYELFSLHSLFNASEYIVCPR